VGGKGKKGTTFPQHPVLSGKLSGSKGQSTRVGNLKPCRKGTAISCRGEDQRGEPLGKFVCEFNRDKRKGIYILNGRRRGSRSICGEEHAENQPVQLFLKSIVKKSV